MVANVSPCSACCEHSLNTLRYAERVKDWQEVERAANRRAAGAGGAAGAANDDDDAPAAPAAPAAPPAPPAPAVGAPPPVGAPAGCFVTPGAGYGYAGRGAAGGAEGAWEGAAAELREAARGGEAAAEEEELSRSLGYGAEQVQAHKAAKALLLAEEQLLSAHAAACKHAALTLPQVSPPLAIALALALALALSLWPYTPSPSPSPDPNQEEALLEGASRDGDVEGYALARTLALTLRTLTLTLSLNPDPKPRTRARTRYARKLRTLLEQKRAQLDSVAAALAEFELRCASEDAARKQVRGPVNLY